MPFPAGLFSGPSVAVSRAVAMAAMAVLNLPEGETCVEIPDRLIPYFQTRT